MRIGILTDYLGRDPWSGFGNYIRNLVKEFSRDHEVWEISASGETLNLPLSGTIRVGRWNWRWRKQIESPTDVVFCPLQQVPEYFYRLNKPRVVTIHGAAPFILGHTALHHPPDKFLLRLRQEESSIDAFVTVSESARKEVMEHFGLASSRIDVIYHGVDAEFFSPPADKKTARARACARSGIPGPYLLHVSNYQPKKNGVRIVAAYHRLCEQGLERFSLVFAGGTYHGFEAVAEEIEKNKVGQIIRIGPVWGEALRELYQGAEVFLFPSLHESFGLTAVESMGCGVPVVASNVFCLPEVLGEAAVLVNPESVEEMAQAAASLLTDSAFYEKKRRAGLARSQQFRWDESAQRHLELFERVVRRERLKKQIAGLNTGTYRMRSYWEKRAELYELDPYLAVCRLLASHDYNERMHATQRRELLPVIGSLLPVSGACVLEVGCGAGRWAKELETLGVCYIGVDISHGMLRQARRQGLSDFFVQSGATSLPFASGSFDLVFTVTALHHIPYEEQPGAIAELVRVTRGGGFLVILEDVSQPPELFNMFSRLREKWIELFEQVGCQVVRTTPVRYPGENHDQATIVVSIKRRE
ncbi:glycosyltransferase [Acidobacteriia bacterium AH_259_A11_L15]|nr:glycosyltransferase [Acidobacteriia bacterium AH_259_A11_L15]